MTNPTGIGGHTDGSPIEDLGHDCYLSDWQCCGCLEANGECCGYPEPVFKKRGAVTIEEVKDDG